MNSKTNLFSYQQRGVEKLLPSRVSGLFMEMGTGKTRTMIEFARLRLGRYDRVVWFCPVSLKETIEQEILKHTDLAPRQVYRFDDKTTTARIDRDALFCIVGTESMSSSNRVAITVNQIITGCTMVVVDESDFIKGHSSRRTERITLMSERAKYRHILTGTPISQGVVDLFAQMKFLSPTILGYRSFYSFANNHLEYSDKFPGMIVRAHNTQLLAAKMQPYVYQVTKDECMDLPDKLFDKRYYSMTPEQRAWYEETKEEILAERTGDEWDDQFIIFRLFTAVQEIVSGFYNRRDPKSGETRTHTFPHERLNILQSAINGIPETAKVIIWCKYLFSINAIVKMLAEQYGERSTAQFHGKLSEDARNAEIVRFRSDARFLVATASSGGRGLTLNEAQYAVFYENSFKYANRQQAEDRQHRIGQTKSPTYIDIVCSRSVDERIQTALSAKQNVADSFRKQVERVKDDPAKLAELVRDL